MLANNKLVKKYKAFLNRNEENKELIRDSIFSFVVRGFSGIASVLMSMVIGRYVGAAESGYFFLAYSVMFVMATVTRLGVDNVILKYTSIHSADKEWNLAQTVLYVTTKWTVIVSLPIGILISVFAHFIAVSVFNKEDLTDSLFWLGFTVPLFVIYTVLSSGLQGIKKVAASIALGNVTIPVMVIITMWCVPVKSSGTLSFIYFMASLISVFIGFYWWIHYSKGKPQKNYDTKPLWQMAKPLWTLTFLRLGVQWGGQFISGFYVASDQLAQLATAQRTSLLVAFILISINLVSAPRFAYLYHQGQLDKLRNYAINSTRLMTAVATPLIIGICVFAKQIMSLFGKDFAGGTWLLIILALGQYVNAISGSVTYLLSMSGHEKDNRNIAIVNFIISIILAITLTPLYGAMGAAIATAVGIATQNLMGVYYVKKRLGFTTLAIKFRK